MSDDEKAQHLLDTDDGLSVATEDREERREPRSAFDKAFYLYQKHNGHFFMVIFILVRGARARDWRRFDRAGGTGMSHCARPLARC